MYGGNEDTEHTPNDDENNNVHDEVFLLQVIYTNLENIYYLEFSNGPVN